MRTHTHPVIHLNRQKFPITGDIIVADYPAYMLLKYPAGLELSAGDIIGIGYDTKYGTLATFYTLGSVASYAEERVQDVDESVARAKLNGHDLYWANQNSVALTNHSEPQTCHFSVSVGDIINFEGKRFRIDAQPYENIKLIEILTISADATNGPHVSPNLSRNTF
jgi:hypothetical protein